jgi:hypothetical protein
MTKDDVQRFFNTWNGKYLDFDHVYGPQCKDVFSAYNDMQGLPYIVGNPINMWRGDIPKASLATLNKYYTKIPNSITAVPKMGDVIIFDVGYTGHISISTNTANILWVTSFEQNYPLGSKCHYVAHNYLRPRVVGWFRPKSLV